MTEYPIVPPPPPPYGAPQSQYYQAYPPPYGYPPPVVETKSGGGIPAFVWIGVGILIATAWSKVRGVIVHHLGLGCGPALGLSLCV